MVHASPTEVFSSLSLGKPPWFQGAVLFSRRPVAQSEFRLLVAIVLRGWLVVLLVACKNDSGGTHRHSRQSQLFSYFERIAIALEILTANWPPFVEAGVVAKPPRKHHCRGAKRKDADGDRRIYDAWKSGGYDTYEECGRALGMRAREIELSVGRYRHWLKRNPGKG
jgi:hypothetical protein